MQANDQTDRRDDAAGCTEEDARSRTFVLEDFFH